MELPSVARNSTWKVQRWSNRKKEEKGKGDTSRSLMTMAAEGVCSVEMVNGRGCRRKIWEARSERPLGKTGTWEGVCVCPT
eukprot:11417708-Heterocapsa_arctica.AAC.1